MFNAKKMNEENLISQTVICGVHLVQCSKTEVWHMAYKEVVNRDVVIKIQNDEWVVILHTGTPWELVLGKADTLERLIIINGKYFAGHSFKAIDLDLTMFG